MSARTYRGYDYRLGESVEHSVARWRQWVDQLYATGTGRTLRHRRRHPGDDDLLLIQHGRIVAEVYDQ